MNDDAYRSDCDILLDYVSGACSEKEREAFESHLKHCRSCKQELAEWQLVWEALPTDMERLEPPKDLKEQIMSAANSAPRRRKPAVRGSWRKLAFAVIAAVLLFFFGSLWDNPLLDDRDPTIPSIEQALSAPASQIVKINMLKSESGKEGRAYGVACIVDNGQSKQFVVYVFGAQQTKDEEAYQVWLVQGGSRTSAGTFRVNDKGIGLLTKVIESGELSYDRIGITLEPDQWGDQPRGPKAFGTDAVL